MKKLLIILLLTVTSLIYFSIMIVTVFKFINPFITPYMVSKFLDGNKLNRKWYAYEEINPNFFKAVIASEDGRFIEHNGFDIKAIKESINYNKRNKGKKRGASTITMQTSKNTFLLHHRNFLRKGMEAYLTVLIEAIWGKKRIIEVYANVIEVGEGKYGVGIASKKFFGKEPSELSKREAALITAVLPNPIRWNPAKPTNYISKRAGTIQARMNDVSLKKFSKEN